MCCVSIVVSLKWAYLACHIIRNQDIQHTQHAHAAAILIRRLCLLELNSMNLHDALQWDLCMVFQRIITCFECVKHVVYLVFGFVSTYLDFCFASDARAFSSLDNKGLGLLLNHRRKFLHGCYGNATLHKKLIWCGLQRFATIQPP